MGTIGKSAQGQVVQVSDVRTVDSYGPYAPVHTAACPERRPTLALSLVSTEQISRGIYVI